MIDSYKRKINYARISLTSICNLKCAYCSQYDGDKKLIPVQFYKNLIDVLAELGIEKIRFTGGEPLLNPNIVELVKYAKSKPSVKDIAITTNGVLFDKYLDELIDSGLTRINLSLDTTSKEIYEDLTGQDKLDVVLENIKKARSKGLKVKVNTVLIKGVTDVEITELLEFGYENNIQIRFIELMPIGDNLDFYNKHYLNSKDIINALECKVVDSDNADVATYYNYKNKYEFGVISAVSNHFCDSCNRIRITSQGKLRLCLHSDNEIDLLEYKDDKEMLHKVLSENIVKKPEKHNITEKEFAKSNMVQIGG